MTYQVLGKIAELFPLYVVHVGSTAMVCQKDEVSVRQFSLTIRGPGVSRE